MCWCRAGRERHVSHVWSLSVAQIVSGSVPERELWRTNNARCVELGPGDVLYLPRAWPRRPPNSARAARNNAVHMQRWRSHSTALTCGHIGMMHVGMLQPSGFTV